MHLSIAGLTDVGRKRRHNEDHFFLSPFPLSEKAARLVDEKEATIRLVQPSQAALCIVADGMGGASAGEVASKMASLGIANQLDAGRDAYLGGADGEIEGSLLEASVAVNRTLWAASAAKEELAGMGTTLTALLVVGTRGYWLQSGDSRLYRLRDGLLEILTPDQSSVGTLFQQGDITEEQARRHPYKNVIDQCMGGNPEDPFEPAAGSIDVQAGDAFVLCSDGLMDGLWDEEIQERLGLLQAGQSAAEVARRLVFDAKEASGADNITAIVAYASELPAESSANAGMVKNWIRERLLGNRYLDMSRSTKRP